ncbi:hypothetical protein L1987_02006 [Smallanthus sonchifolius]|uniref:Uncharacterized protein n=1 Tax=Smallanthus sonchifolius TaxID=185202 RepID=A0ACB9K6L8_9ASTR|nr:hypothetical protein L1987_02006 [Smallanthus sonchifolius]
MNDVECLIKKGTENHPHDDDFTRFKSAYEGKIIKFTSNKGEVSNKDVVKTKETDDTQDKYGLELSQYDIRNFVFQYEHGAAVPRVSFKTLHPNIYLHVVNNSLDCGVFVMRHMETYKCTSIKEWKWGLDKECEWQKTQLNDMRLKYLAKILLYDINKHKQAVESEVRDYVQLEDGLKNKMKSTVYERIKARAAKAL